MLSFTQYTQSVSLGKCSTIVSNRFTRLSLNVVRCSNIRLPSALRPTDVYSYIVCLAYILHPLSLIKSVLPKVVNSCIPTLMLDTFNNPVLLFFLWLSWPSSILFTHLMTERVYWDDALGVITLVYFRAFTALMTN